MGCVPKCFRGHNAVSSISGPADPNDPGRMRPAPPPVVAPPPRNPTDPTGPGPSHERERKPSRDHEHERKRSTDPVILPAITEDISARYRAGPVIGTGAYGIVIGCTEVTTGARYACKSVDVMRLLDTADGPNVAGRLRNEVAIMSYLAGHPNIVRLHDVHERNERIFIVQEMCTGGSLKEAIRAGLTEARAAQLFRGLVRSVIHCHLMGVMHRDIKPENFLLSTRAPDAVVKLADFGLACFFRRDELLKEAVGSPLFMAPETVARKSKGYGPAADLWSCGVCLFQMLSSGDDYPFDGTQSAEVFAALRDPWAEADFGAPAWRNVAPDALDLVRRILHKDPRKRIQAQDVMAHPWLTRHRRTSPATLPSSVFQINEIGGSARTRGFVDTFKSSVEEPYIRLLQAQDATGAAAAWCQMREGLTALDTFLTAHGRKGSGSGSGAATPKKWYFQGDEPSIAEAGTAPSLCRMNATLPVVRGMPKLADTCQKMGLERLAKWVAEVLGDPAACCDVAELPAEAYVHMARRLHVTYEGPATI